MDPFYGKPYGCDLQSFVSQIKLLSSSQLPLCFKYWEQTRVFPLQAFMTKKCSLKNSIILRWCLCRQICVFYPGYLVLSLPSLWKLCLTCFFHVLNKTWKQWIKGMFTGGTRTSFTKCCATFCGLTFHKKRNHRQSKHTIMQAIKNFTDSLLLFYRKDIYEIRSKPIR